MALNIEFVFVHSYWSNFENWETVQIGREGSEGRLLTALRLSEALGTTVLANDAIDARNKSLYHAHGIENLETAKCTFDEVGSALAASTCGCVLFVTSPDHLPRVVRDVMICGGHNAVFASSQTPMSELGATGVKIIEPRYEK